MKSRMLDLPTNFYKKVSEAQLKEIIDMFIGCERREWYEQQQD